MRLGATHSQWPHCVPTQSAHCVCDIWMKAFVNMDLIFIATKPTNTCGMVCIAPSSPTIFVFKSGEIKYHVGSDLGLVNAVSVVVLGYFSPLHVL